MKITKAIEINQPQQFVAEMFHDPENLKYYHDGFLRKELISGKSGELEAVSKLYYQQGKGEMELTETITANHLPDSFEAFYHHIHMDNTMKCKFIPLAENKTRFEIEVEYLRMAWIMPRLMAFLFPGMFRKQIDKWIKDFKTFAEKQ